MRLKGDTTRAHGAREGETGLPGKLLAIALVLLAGCAGTRPAYAPEPAPGALIPPSPPGRVELFVSAVPVPDPTTTPEVSLEQLLAYADQHAPATRVARVRALRGDAEVEAASPFLKDNPELAFGLGRRSVASSTFVDTELSLQQTLELAGERGLRIETAERTREVALAEQDETRLRAHAEVHGLFLEALVARERVAAAEQVVRFAEDLQRIAQRRVDAGDDAPLSMLVARADLAQARELEVAALQEESAVGGTLAEVSGWPAGLPLRPKGNAPPIRTTRALPDLVRLAAQHHPALRTQALAVAEAQARVSLEEREAWPEPTVGVERSREGDAPDAARIWLFTVGLPLPVWNRNQGERARAAVALDLARVEQATLGARLQAQLARAATRVDAAARRVRIYGEELVPAVERNLEIIRRAYELGEIDLLEVSQTRQRVLDSQGRSIAARSEYFQALAELEALVGTELDDAALRETTP